MSLSLKQDDQGWGGMFYAVSREFLSRTETKSIQILSHSLELGEGPALWGWLTSDDQLLMWVEVLCAVCYARQLKARTLSAVCFVTVTILGYMCLR